MLSKTGMQEPLLVCKQQRRKRGKEEEEMKIDETEGRHSQRHSRQGQGEQQRAWEGFLWVDVVLWKDLDSGCIPLGNKKKKGNCQFKNETNGNYNYKRKKKSVIMADDTM